MEVHSYSEAQFLLLGPTPSQLPPLAQEKIQVVEIDPPLKRGRAVGASVGNLPVDSFGTVVNAILHHNIYYETKIMLQGSFLEHTPHSQKLT